MDQATREAVYERAGGRCEISGARLRPDGFGHFEVHHRRNKGMGGTSRPDVDNLSNLLALDPQVHNGGPTSVHGRRRWSQARGYLIPKHVDHPGHWPVWLRRGRNVWEWVILGDDGQYYPVPVPLAAPDDLV